jgi:hypothetical protein
MIYWWNTQVFIKDISLIQVNKHVFRRTIVVMKTIGLMINAILIVVKAQIRLQGAFSTLYSAF